jgi:hypothetical protein
MNCYQVDLWVRAKILYPLWKITACVVGRHRGTSRLTGGPVNFCEACHVQLNPNSYKWYQVLSTDGSLDVKVAAVNHRHAEAFFVHRYHRANLVTETLCDATGMTVEQWRSEMHEYIDQVPSVMVANGVSVKMR